MPFGEVELQKGKSFRQIWRTYLNVKLETSPDSRIKQMLVVSGRNDGNVRGQEVDVLK